jgi:hypothetical protein
MLLEMKVKYSNPYNSEKIKDSFIPKYLSKNAVLNESEEKDSIIFEYVHKRFSKDFFKFKRKVLISGENLYYQLTLFKIIEGLSKKKKIILKIFKKIIPHFILNYPLGTIRRKYLSYIRKISKRNPENQFAIITNSMPGKNILVLPYFLQVRQILDNFDKIIARNQEKEKNKKFCCLIVSNESAADRIKFAQELSKYKKVDIYGRTSLTNADNNRLPKGCFENYKFFSNYKFVICFENSFAKDYITEKLPEVMIGNSIPIYKGASNVSEYFNSRSFINFDDYGSHEKMIEKIIELDKDEGKYLKFKKQAWLTKQNKAKIKQKQKEAKEFFKIVFKENAD